MKVSIFSVRGRNQLSKTMQNVRMTLVCGLLTFIVLRSSFGAGKFRTPVQDYDDIRHHLKSFKMRRQHRLLISEGAHALKELTSRSTLSSIYQRNTLSLSMAKANRDSELRVIDNAEAKASNWDHHRAAWLASQPSILRNTSHVMLVSSTSMLADTCDNAMEAQFLLKSLKNKMDYCRLHHIEFFYNLKGNAWDATEKPMLLWKLMLAHPEVEWIWSMESDSMFTDMVYELPTEKYEDVNVIIHGGDDGDGKKAWTGGSFLLRNCQWSLDMLEEWAAAEAGERRYAIEGQVRSDDRKAEMYHPGVGDGNLWPFVTHFSACNMCGKDVDVACLEHMERAFIFADSQHMHLGE